MCGEPDINSVRMYDIHMARSCVIFFLFLGTTDTRLPFRGRQLPPTTPTQTLPSFILRCPSFASCTTYKATIPTPQQRRIQRSIQHRTHTGRSRSRSSVNDFSDTYTDRSRYPSMLQFQISAIPARRGARMLFIAGLALRWLKCLWRA